MHKSFSDPHQALAELTFQGAHELAIESSCNSRVLEALSAWKQREDKCNPSSELFRLPEVRVFTISYEGAVDDYYPSKEANLLGESLVREFLYRDGICTVKTGQERLYAANYRVIALEETEYLLVCPFETRSGNIAGLVVVCVNQHMCL
ncbi:MAG: hypothetical protein ACPGJE_01760 [Wenzhouxiangellaceae bacterium]